MEESCLHAALYLALNGRSVIPVGKEKIPLIKWTDFQERIATEKEIRSWWKKFPDANLGLITGKISGLLVVDCDNQEAIDKMHELLPDTIEIPIQKTPRGSGRHFFFSYRPGFTNRAKVAPGMDIRTDGGYVMISPSQDDRGRWEWECLNILDHDGPEMPETVVRYFAGLSGATGSFGVSFYSRGYSGYTEDEGRGTIYNNINKYKHSLRGGDDAVGQLDFTEGSRNNTIFNVGFKFKVGGASDIELSDLIRNLALFCSPPLEEKDQVSIFRSILQRVAKFRRKAASSASSLPVSASSLPVLRGDDADVTPNDADDAANDADVTPNVALTLQDGTEKQYGDFVNRLDEWIKDNESGTFSNQDIYRDFDLRGEGEKSVARTALTRLVRDGRIERIQTRQGFFRIVEGGMLELMDFKRSTLDNKLDLTLPLDIHEKTVSFPRNVIIIAGVQGYGKTTFLFNIIKENMHKFNFIYFSSEMAPQTVKHKLSFFRIPIEHWKFDAVPDTAWNFRNIQDKVRPDWINVIDYLEPEGDRTYDIHAVITAIIKRLDKGMAIIATQKKKGQEYEYSSGGKYTAQAASLYLSLDYNVIQITKNRFREMDPELYLTRRNFTLDPGQIFNPTSKWYDPFEEKKRKGKEKWFEKQRERDD